jgi:hypothetical protein
MRAVLEAEQGRKVSTTITHIHPEVQANVVKVLRLGNYRSAAATFAGISLRTMERWMKLGESRPGSEYEAFRSVVLKAEVEAEIGCVSRILLDGQRDARHAEWWLEHRDGEWRNGPGKPARLPTPAQPEQISTDLLADDELRHLLDRAAARAEQLREAQASQQVRSATSVVREAHPSAGHEHLPPNPAEAEKHPRGELAVSETQNLGAAQLDHGQSVPIPDSPAEGKARPARLTMRDFLGEDQWTRWR